MISLWETVCNLLRITQGNTAVRRSHDVSSNGAQWLSDISSLCASLNLMPKHSATLNAPCRRSTGSPLTPPTSQFVLPRALSALVDRLSVSSIQHTEVLGVTSIRTVCLVNWTDALNAHGDSWAPRRGPHGLLVCDPIHWVAFRLA